MEFALLLQACLLMSTLERFSYDVLFCFFLLFFLFSAGVLLCCCEQKLILSHKSCFCSPNEMPCHGESNTKTRHNNVSTKQRSRTVSFIIFLHVFWVLVVFTAAKKQPAWSQCSSVFPLSISSSCCLTCAIHLTFTCICTNGGKNSSPFVNVLGNMAYIM